MKNRNLLLLVFVVVMFAVAASAQDDAVAIEQTKAKLLAEAEAARVKAKPSGFIAEIHKKRQITINYIDLFVNDKIDKANKALADNDFDTAFVLNSEIMPLIYKQRELLGDELYGKYKAEFLSQHDMIVKAANKYQAEKKVIEDAAKLRRETERKKVVKQYLQSATDLVKNYQYEEALVMIEKVLRLDPNNDEANMQEVILTDFIRWREDGKVKQQIRELERKTQNSGACDGCMPNPDEITYPTPNGIIFAKKYTSPKHKEEAIRSACDAYMDSICDHMLKSRFEQALKLVSIVLKYQADNEKALTLEACLNDNIRWRKENNKLAYLAVNKQLDSTVDLSSLSADTTFYDAINIIRKSVEPELAVTVLWEDLERVSIKRDDAIGICGLGFTSLPLKTGIERVLRAMGNKDAELDYSVEDGVVTIATKKTLQKRIEKFFGTAGKVKKANDKAE